jgi:hypothetical protein
MLSLTAFCKSSNFDAGTPWIKNGWEYGTDGAILVRRPTTDPDNRNGRHLPNAAKLLDGPHNYQAEWPVPDGLSRDGKSIFAPNSKVAGRTIAGGYALLICLLGKVYYDPSGGPEEAIYFRAADGTEGAVMPLERSRHCAD